MANGTFFVQQCPTCGRRLNIRVAYLGRTVMCQHCRGQFTARDPSSQGSPEAGSAEAIMLRADELLRYVSECENRSHLLRPR